MRRIADYIVRCCTINDLTSVIDINTKTLPEHYSLYFYESLLSELPDAFLVAEISGSCIGYIMCKIDYGFSSFKKLGFVKKGHVVSVAVLKEYRNNGIGTVLIIDAIKGVRSHKCDELYLEVRCSNNDAIKLYEKIGFIIKNRLQSYYHDGEDAYIMSIELNY